MKRAVLIVSLLLGMHNLLAQEKPRAGVTVDPSRRQVIIPAKVAPRQLPHLDKVYPIELIAGWPHPKGKKAHEIVVSIEVMPSEVHKALEQLGLKPGKPAKGEGTKAQGPVVQVYLEVPDGPGEFKRVPLEKVLWDPKTKKAPPKMTFIFTGSVFSPRDPSKPDDKVYGADLTGSLITLFPVTDEVVLQTTWTMKEEKFLKLDVNPEALPPVGSPVQLVIEAPPQ
jgi:hypothetical protein